MGRALGDEQQIANLLYRYAELVDAADFDGVGELFARGAYGLPTATVAGGAPLAGLMRRSIVFHDGRMGTKHLTTNLLIEVVDDRSSATCRSYFCVMQAAPTLPLQTIITGHYHDRFERDDDGWFFIERHVFIDQTGDISQHLRRSPT